MNYFALVAQLDRAFGYEPKGQGFESLRAHQIDIKLELYRFRVLICLNLYYNSKIVFKMLIHYDVSIFFLLGSLHFF